MNWRIKQVSFKTITFSAVTLWIGFYAWRILFNNFAVEVFNASPTDVGLIQAIREIPGLLAIGAGALAVYFAESRITSLGVVAVGLGLVLCGMSPSLIVLGAATFLMSLGFHYFEPANTSQLLILAKADNLGRVQGRLTSYESMAGLAGAGAILGLTLILDFRDTFFLIGGAVTLIGIYLTFALPSNRGVAEKRQVLIKRKYWLYYTLSFLRGCRRHIFTTFALFLLVKNHELSITYISIIMLMNNFITIFTNRLLGRLSDSLGERIILVSSSSVLVFIFSGYALVTYLPALIAFYLIDNIMFGSSVALKSYIRKISTSEDLTGCLSFGMTANHITAVIIPVAGGIIWNLFGYQATFIAGAVIVFIDMLFALKIPRRGTMA